MELYQAMKLRTEHGQLQLTFMPPASWIKNIWMILILKPAMMKIKTHWMIQKMILNLWYWKMILITRWLQLYKLENPEGVTLNIGEHSFFEWYSLVCSLCTHVYHHSSRIECSFALSALSSWPSGEL